MNLKRYILTPCVVTKDNNLIPYWSDDIKFEKTEMYGNILHLPNSNKHTSNLVDGIFDLKTKTISPGIVLEHYPETVVPAVDEECYVEVDYFDCKEHNMVEEVKIKEILFENFTMNIKKGKKIEEYWLKYFHSKNIVIDPNQMYCIKQYEPTWVLDNGEKITYPYKLKRKYKRS